MSRIFREIEPVAKPKALLKENADRALHVIATVSPTFEVSSVHAAVGAHETELTFATEAYSRFGTLLPGWIVILI